MRDVCDRTEKVEVIERVNESVGSPKGIWEDVHNRKFEWYLSVIPVVSFNGQKFLLKRTPQARMRAAQ